MLSVPLPLSLSLSLSLSMSLSLSLSLSLSFSCRFRSACVAAQECCSARSLLVMQADVAGCGSLFPPFQIRNVRVLSGWNVPRFPKIGSTVFPKMFVFLGIFAMAEGMRLVFPDICSRCSQNACFPEDWAIVDGIWRVSLGLSVRPENVP